MYIMVYTNEFTKPVHGEIGSRRRRRWTAAEKGRIVAEAVTPGAVMAAVSRRHDLTPQHLSNWVTAAKQGRLVLPAESDVAFVPVIAGEEAREARAGQRASSLPIEIVIGSCIVRVSKGADAQTLESVVRAVRRAEP